MDDEQLDILCLGVDDDMDSFKFNDEITCTAMRGKFRSNRRNVPRLPIAAMISRMKILEDSTQDGVTRGRGRAKLLSDRARYFKHPAHTQRKPAQKHHATEPTNISFGKKPFKQTTVNHQQPEEFPSLGFEHTVEGSPTKKHKSNMPSNEVTEERVDEHYVALDEERVPEHQPEPFTLQPRPVQSKKSKFKKFDFTKANKSLLDEFPFPKNTPQLLSLTQHNLEKFMRESDSESNCSSAHDVQIANPIKEFEDDDVPLYEKYAVTLDDIMRSRYTQVPFNLKGQLATLLNTPETYHTNPDDYIEKTDAHHLVPDLTACTAEDQRPSRANSTNSVVSDLSSLNSPSDEESTMDQTEPTSCVRVDQTEPTSCVNVRNDTNSPLTDGIQRVSGGISEGCEASGNVISDNVTMCGDGNKVIKSSSKHSGNTGNDEPVSVNTVSAHSKWKLQGEKVIQIDGVPAQCDLTILQEYVRAFGAITGVQQLHVTDRVTSVRFKLDSEDACDYAVQCLHDSDCIYPDCKLSCQHLQN